MFGREVWYCMTLGIFFFDSGVIKLYGYVLGGFLFLCFSLDFVCFFCN